MKGWRSIRALARYAGALILFTSVAAQAQALSVYADIEGWAFAEPVPVTAFADKWDAPLDRGSDGHALLHAESGIRIGDWRVGWALQRQYVVKASRGAAELYHLTRNSAEPPANQRYDVDLRANFYEARGLRLGRRLAKTRFGEIALHVEPSLMLWEGIAFEDGRLQGLATTDADARLAYAATIDHAYSEDVLLDRTVARPRGRGASLDLDLEYSVGAQWSGSLRTRNLLGRLWWDDAPYTRGTLSSDTQQTDDDGLIRFAPTLSGFEGNRSHRQRLPMFAETALRRHFGQHALGVQLVHTEIGRFHGLHWAYEHRGVRTSVQWLPDARDAVNLGLAWRMLELSVGGSALRWDDADQLQVQIAFKVPLRAVGTSRGDRGDAGTDKQSK